MRLTLKVYFRKQHINSFQNIPKDGPFIIVSNHPSFFRLVRFMILFRDEYLNNFRMTGNPVKVNNAAPVMLNAANKPKSCNTPEFVNNKAPNAINMLNALVKGVRKFLLFYCKWI